MKTNRRESEIQAGILGYLGTRGDCFFWRANSMALSPRPGAFIRAGLPGMPDILLALAPTGRMVGLEIKREIGGRVSPAQKLWGAALEAKGGLWAVACSIADVEKALGPVSVRPAR